MLVTVGGDSGVHVSVGGEEMQGPLQIRRAQMPHFPKKVSPREENLTCPRLQSKLK